MDKRKLLLMLGAMVIAVGTALAARSMLTRGQGAPAPVQTAARAAPRGLRVLVAQRALPPGTIITADAVGFQDWPATMGRDAYFVDGRIDMNRLIGTVVRYPVTAGQPLTQGALVAPGDRGFLAAALGPGMRAITITVSEKTGVAGFIFPGDRVDVMLTQTLRGGGADAMALNATETILRNLRVLATDQSTSHDSADGKTVVRTFHTVTLEVTPKIAEKIEVAQAVGTLSLTLRSLAESQGDLDRALARGDVRLPQGASQADEERAIEAIAHSPVDTGGTVTTGAEVSRFQKGTLPMAAAGPAAPAMAGSARPRPMADYGVRVMRGRESLAAPITAPAMPPPAMPPASMPVASMPIAQPAPGASPLLPH